MEVSEPRPLGNSGIMISSIALGCWPIAGMTTLEVNEQDSLATIQTCFEVGINHFDTAFAYGVEGESERLIARAIKGRRDEVVIATKGGILWGPDRKQVVDGRPATLRSHCDESLRRLETDRVELLYLHAPDPNVPVAESAGALKELLDQGKTRSVGVSNFDVQELEEFSAVCPISAFQPPYNMLQRDIERDTLPWCQSHNVAVMVYWPLMKGLLAGKLRRDHAFAPGDGRAKYPMFQGTEWQKNQDFLDELRAIAGDIGKTVSQVVLNWTIHQEGITAALCGAKRPHQVRENAGAMGWTLDPSHILQIERALQRRGQVITKAAV